jgi:hypothetical protein
MSMEYVGVIEVEPRLSRDEVYWMADGNATGWMVSRDGRVLRPRPGIDLEVGLHSLRDLVCTERGSHRFEGAVAAYDSQSGTLVLITVGNGRVSRRTVRSRPARSTGSNVIDLASRRRTTSRAIS